MGPRAHLGGCRQSRPPPPGFDSRSMQPLASCYTDYTVLAHIKEPQGTESFSVAGRFRLIEYCRYGLSGSHIIRTVNFLRRRQVCIMLRFRSRQISLYDNMTDVYFYYSILAWGAKQFCSRYRSVVGICCFLLESRTVTRAREGSCRYKKVWTNGI